MGKRRRQSVDHSFIWLAELLHRDAGVDHSHFRRPLFFLPSLLPSSQVIESKKPKADGRTPKTSTGGGFRGDPLLNVTPLWALLTSCILLLLSSCGWLIPECHFKGDPFPWGKNNPAASIEMIIAFIDTIWLGNESKTIRQPSESACFPEPPSPLVSAPVLISSYVA